MPHLWSPHISTSSSLSHVLSLLPPHLPSPLFSFSTLLLLNSFPLLPPSLASLCFPSFFLASLSFLPQMNWRASPPPVDLGLRDTAVVYIYFFSIVVVVIIINIIATEQFTQMGSGGQLQRHTRSSTSEDKSPPPSHHNHSGFILMSSAGPPHPAHPLPHRQLMYFI